MFKNVNFEALGIGGSQREQIELTLSYGFKGFDLDLADFSSQVQRDGADRARRLIDSARLRLGSFVCPIEFDAEEATYQEQLQQLPALIEMAAAVGADRCRTEMTPASDLRPYHENFELWRTRLGQVSEILEPHNVRLGVGLVAPAHHRANRAFQFVHTFDALLLLVKSVQSSSIGVWFDTWHWHVAGGTLDQLRALTVDDLVGVDVAEATTPSGVDDVHETARILPVASEEIASEEIASAEASMVDLTSIFRILGDVDFDGPVTPKPAAGQMSGQTRDQIVKAASAAIDRAWSEAGIDARGRLAKSPS